MSKVIFDSSKFKVNQDYDKFVIGDREFLARPIEPTEIEVLQELGALSELSNNSSNADQLKIIVESLKVCARILEPRAVDKQPLPVEFLREHLPTLEALTAFYTVITSLIPKVNPGTVNHPTGLSRSQRRRLAKKQKMQAKAQEAN
jgi:hypothetical protein